MSELRRLCREQYAARVAMRQDIPNELKRALKTHERVPVFVDNLVKQLNHPKIRKDIGQATIIMAIHDMTDIYINNVMKMADERRLSDLEKSRRVKKSEDLQLVRDLADSMMGEAGEHTLGEKNTGREPVEVKTDEVRKLEQL
jgi:proline dehydrogenase